MNVGNVGIMPQMAQANPMSNAASSFMQGMFDTVKLALTMQRDRQKDAQDAAYNQARTGLINSQIQEYNDNAAQKQAVRDYLANKIKSNSPQPSVSSGGLFNIGTQDANDPTHSAGLQPDISGGGGLFNSNQQQMSIDPQRDMFRGNPGFDENTRNSFVQGFYDTTKLALQMARDKQQPQQTDMLPQQPQTSQPQMQPEQPAVEQSSPQFTVEKAMQTFIDMAGLTGDPTYLEKAAALIHETKYGTTTVHTNGGDQTFVTINGKPDMTQPVGTAKPDTQNWIPWGNGQMKNTVTGEVVNVHVKPDKQSYGHIWIPSQDGKSKQLYQTVDGKPVAALGGKVPMSGAANGVDEKYLVSKLDALKSQETAIIAGTNIMNSDGKDAAIANVKNQQLNIIRQLKALNPNSKSLPAWAKKGGHKKNTNDPLGLRP